MAQKTLVKKEREAIFELFLDKTKLKFSDIEKALSIRSNMVAYHLEQMIKQGLLEKKDDNYKLTSNAEKYIPVFEHVTGQEQSPLPIILVAVVHNGEVLLIQRNKRPYKDYWSLIGGKMLLEENFEQASLRLAKEKTGLEVEYDNVNAVLQEHVRGDDILKHSFILFLTTVKATTTQPKATNHGRLQWFALDELNKKEIIPSDYWLITNKLYHKADVTNAFMTEQNGELTSFKIIKNNS
ncbi:NUDIX domain-containing protein [Candidatus Woesearchaeota archaeon]|nr:NUDIX domain-containing protein [Candidatus Woesearchaeota archaeon]